MPWSWHPQISPTLPLCSVMSDTCSLLREVVKKRTHISYCQVKKGSKRVQKWAKKNFTKCKHGKHKRFTVHLLDHHQTKPAFPPITVFIHFNWFLIEMAACVQKEFLAHFLLIWSVLYLAGGETGLWRIVWVFYYFDFFVFLYFVFCWRDKIVTNCVGILQFDSFCIFVLYNFTSCVFCWWDRIVTNCVGILQFDRQLHLSWLFPRPRGQELIGQFLKLKFATKPNSADFVRLAMY